MSDLHNAGKVERKQEIKDPNKIRLYLYFATNSQGKPLFGHNIRSIITLPIYDTKEKLIEAGIINVEVDDNGPYIDILVSTDENFGVDEIVEKYEIYGGITSIETGTGYGDNAIIFEDKIEKKGVLVFGSFKPFDFNVELGPTNKLFFLRNFKPSHPKEKEATQNPWEFELDSVLLMQEQYESCALYFFSTETRSNNNQLSIPNDCKIGYIRILGEHTILDENKSSLTKNYGFVEIDMTPNTFLPMKFTPTKIENNFDFYGDWYDNDNVIPYFVAKLFQNENNLSKKATLDNGIELPILEDADIKLLLDLLFISYGFSNAWNFLPTTEGKIVGSTLITYKGITAATVLNQKPRDFSNHLINLHIRNEEGFKTGTKRFKLVSSFVKALSSYLEVDMAVSGGNNYFNQVLLPWYLKLNKKIENSTDIEKVKIRNPNNKNVEVDTWVFKTDIKFIIQSAYFSMNYSKNTNLLHSPLLEIPETINFNDTILIQTDKKITIPEIPNELGIIDKTTLQIKNESVEDNLKYIFYIPVQSDEEKEKILAGELVYDGEDTGQIVSIHIPDGPLGVGFTQEGIEGHNELVKWINRVLTGEIIDYPTETRKSVPIKVSYQTRGDRFGYGINETVFKQYRILMEATFKDRKYTHIISGYSFNKIDDLSDSEKAKIFIPALKEMFGISKTYYYIAPSQTKSHNSANYIYKNWTTTKTQQTRLAYITFPTNARIRTLKKTVYDLDNKNIIFNSYKWKQFYNSIIPFRWIDISLTPKKNITLDRIDEIHLNIVYLDYIIFSNKKIQIKDKGFNNNFTRIIFID